MIEVEFKTKEKVNFSPKGDTDVFNDILFAKINLAEYSQNFKIFGKWVYKNAQGEHFVKNISIIKGDIELKELERDFGTINVSYLAEANMIRIKELFPKLLDIKKANNEEKENFNLGSLDIEYVSKTEL